MPASPEVEEVENTSLSIQHSDLTALTNIKSDITEADLALKNAATQRRFTRSSRPSRMGLGTVVKPTSQFSRKCQFVFGKISAFISMVAERTHKYLKRVFTLSLVRGDPISYARTEDFDAAGKPIKKNEDDKFEFEKRMDLIEAACNYTEKTKMIFQKILADRKEFAANKKRYAKDIDWNKLAPWTESFLSHLESTFQVFDTSGDALVDYDEMSAMLTDYGDKTEPEERLQVFASADPAGKGALNFIEFVTMFHNITVKSPDSYPSSIVESFRSIERNMSRIRGLDVVQQLQAGLF